MKNKNKQFRIVYLRDYGKTISEIVSDTQYCVIGNSDIFKIKSLKRDWGNGSRWGKRIRI